MDSLNRAGGNSRFLRRFRVAWLALGAAIPLIGLARPALAFRTINSVTLNGMTNVSVDPGGSLLISATLEVTTGGLNANDDWQSSSWAISAGSPGTFTCEDHDDHFNDGTYTESFNVTAPMTPGIYDSFFVAHENDSCGLLNSFTYRAGRVVVEGCGNGILESGEDCDDGAANGDGSSCCASDCTYEPGCSFACADVLEATITRTGLLAIQDDADEYTITNDSSAGITVTSVTIRLTANTQFDTTPLVGAEFTRGAGEVETGNQSPSNGGVADGATAITLAFDDFDPGESFTFTLDTDFDAPLLGISLPTGAQLAGSLLIVTFSDGSSTITGVGELGDSGGNSNAATVGRSTDGIGCSDGNSCTGDDACSGGMCVGTSIPGCTDSDDDGVDDIVEDGAPDVGGLPAGDGDGDGIADRLQRATTSLPTATGAGYVTLVTSTCNQNLDVMAFAEGVPPIPDDPDAAYAYGLIGFKLCSDDGDTDDGDLCDSTTPCTAATVTATFHGAGDASRLTYRKYGPIVPGDPGSTEFYDFPAAAFVAPNVFVLTLADGVLGDSTGPDGMIVDPGGPSAATPPAPAPALSHLGLLIGLLAMGAVAFGSLRRQRSLR